MRFFKKPRQYKIEVEADDYSMFYVLYVRNRCFRYWEYLNLYGHTRPDALERLRAKAALDAKVKGYGDNYEITELV